jgi:hypothetical protein
VTKKLDVAQFFQATALSAGSEAAGRSAPTAPKSFWDIQRNSLGRYDDDDKRLRSDFNGISAALDVSSGGYSSISARVAASIQHVWGNCSASPPRIAS